MKKVYIPIVENKQIDNGNNINKIIKEAKTLLGINDNIKISSALDVLSQIDIDILCNKLINDIALNRYELMFIYNIYNSHIIFNIINWFSYDMGGYAGTEWNLISNLSTIVDISNWWFFANFNKYSKEIKNTLKNALNNRDIYYDMATIFNCEDTEIARSMKELNNNPSKYVVLLDKLFYCKRDYPKLRYVYKDVYWAHQDARYLSNLECIGGYADMSELAHAYGLESLISIGGNAYFNNLSNAEGLEKLESIGGKVVNFKKLEDAKRLTSLKYILGDVNFEWLRDSQGLNNLKFIGGRANLFLLRKFQGLESLEYTESFDDFSRIAPQDDIEKLKNRVKTKKR